MRVLGSQPLVFAQRPFAASLGVSLYYGYTAAGIFYRRNQIFDGADSFITLDDTIGLTTPFPKTHLASQVNSPTTTIHASLPSTAWGQQIWVQLRPFGNDYENETIFRPVQITLDGSGNVLEFLAGAFSLLSVTPGDSGSAAISFAWVLDRQSVAVAHFVATRVSGTSSPSPTLLTPSSARIQILTIAGLSTGTYVFAITAVSALGTVFACGTVTVMIPAAPTTTANLTYIED